MSISSTANSKVNLDYTGTRNITSLTLGGVPQSGGTHGSTTSPAVNKNDTYFSGNGTVTVPLSSAKDILTFSFGALGSAAIGASTINLDVPIGTDRTALAPTYTLSPGATCSPISGTSLNFTLAQIYTVTAQDGSTNAYTVTVTEAILPSTFTWVNSAGGNWSVAANWTNEESIVVAPQAGGRATYTLNFNTAGTYTATHNLNAGFLLNRLNFGGSTVTLAGNSLAFTANGATLPQINQNSASGVTLSAPLSLATNVTLGGSGSGSVTLSGGIFSTGSLTKNNSGTLTLSGASTYSGGTAINMGSLSLGSTANNLLGTGPVIVNSPSTLNLNGNNNLTNAFTLNGALLVNGNSFSANLNGPVTLTSTSTFDVGTTGNMSIGGNVTGTGGVTKIGTGFGPLILGGANSFTGPVAVQGGTLSVASLNRVNGGAATSNLGAPTNSASGTISLGSASTTGTLLYTGPGETTDRIIKLAGITGGATITQGGTASGIPTTRGESGLLKFTSNVSAPGTVGADNRKILTLNHAASFDSGFVMGRGEISGSIGDSLLGSAGQVATSVTKAGPGIWTLSGTNTYTGATKVQAGVLICTRANALGGGALDISNGAKLALDYVGTRQVSALTFDGGAIRPNGTYGSSISPAATKDDTHFAGIGTVTVGAIASPTTNTLTLTSGANPSAGGAALTFTATITGGNAPSGNVVFYDELTAIGTNALNDSFQAAFSTSLLTGGVHTLTALYLGNTSNSPSASAPLSQTVVDSRPATATTLALTGGANPSSLGAAVTFTATVTGAMPTGTVNFYDGTAWVGASPLNGSFQASLTTSNLPTGWRGITARYLGDANNAPSTSASPRWQTVKPRPGNGKLKVFILAGQSNMQGKGQVENGRNPNNLSGPNIAGGLGSLRHMLAVNTNKYGYLADTNNPTTSTVPGWRTMTNVWVTYWSDSGGENRRGNLDADFGDGGGQGRVGPEYGFGLVAGSQLGDQVLLIKTAWGGKSLKVDFRPPSSGGTVGPYYTNMVGIVHRVLNNLGTTYFPGYSGGGYEIVGFGWHQGWNDIGESTREYETNLVNLIRDIRAEFGVPSLPFAIATTAMANASGDQLLLCAAQAAVANPVLHPELAGTVFTVDARPFDYGQLLGIGTEGYHWFWNAESYFNIGQSMGLGMMSLLSSPPAVTNAPATGITATSAVLNASVAWPYTPCNVSAWWNTFNGGTNPAAWVNSAAAGSWTNTTPTNQYGLPGDFILAGGSWANVVSTNLSRSVTGLAPNTTYYFTFCATNRTVSNVLLTNVQTLWATNVLSFTTLAPVPPTPVLPPSAITMSAGVPSFSFATVAGYKYRLVCNNTLTDVAWLPVIAPPDFPLPEGWSATSSGGPMSLTDTNALGLPQRFYRLEAASP